MINTKKIMDPIFYKNSSNLIIRNLVDKRGLSFKHLAYVSGRSPSTIYKLLNIHNGTYIFASSIVSLGHALGYNVSDNIRLLKSIRPTHKRPSYIIRDSRNKFTNNDRRIAIQHSCDDSQSLWTANLIHLQEKRSSLDTISKNSGLSKDVLWSIEQGGDELLPICIYDGINKRKIFNKCIPTVTNIMCNRTQITKLAHALYIDPSFLSAILQHDYIMMH